MGRGSSKSRRVRRWSMAVGVISEMSSAAGSLQVDPDGITRALGDPVFHGYIKIAFCVERVTSELSSWSSGCACHEHIRRYISKHTWKIFSERHSGRRWRTCPLSGCRAPELAAGKLRDVMEVLWGDIEVDLAGVLSSHGSSSSGPTSQARIMEAFRAAQVAMNGILYEKLSFWTQLPWMLAGVAHQSEGVAVRIACDALRLFDDLAGEDDSVHHRITLKLLGPGSSFVEDLRALAAGTRTRRECSNTFLLELARWKLIPVNETSIEGKHASVTSRSCHIPFGPIRVSLSNRMALFTDGYYRWGEPWVDSFLEHFEMCRGPTAVPGILQFDTHPELAEFLRRHKSQAKGRKGLVRRYPVRLAHVYRRLSTDVMHRCDTRAMYAALKDQAKENNKRKKKEADDAKRLLASVRPVLEDREVVLTTLLQSHWLKYAVSGAVFSVKKSTLASAGLVPLGAFVQEPAAKRAKCKRESAGDDDAPPALVDDDADSYAYFSVVQTSSASGSKKKVRAPIGSGSRLGPRHILLCRMKATKMNDDVYVRSMPDFEGTALDPLLVLDGVSTLGPFDTLVDDLRIWDRGTSVCYCVPGNGVIDADIRDVCTLLVERNAYSGGKCTGLPEWSGNQLDALDWLRRNGFIEDAAAQAPGQGGVRVELSDGLRHGVGAAAGAERGLSQVGKGRGERRLRSRRGEGEGMRMRLGQKARQGRAVMGQEEGE
eukprot:9480400-Pyramimonas_sp.AAC.1